MWHRILFAVFLLAPSFTLHADDYLSPEQAQKLLFPQASVFVPVELVFSSKQQKEIKKATGTRQREKKLNTVRAESDGKTLGWVIVDNVIGKHEYITYALAITNKGKVKGMEILSYRETHGGEVRNKDWRAQFKGKSLENKLKLGDDIDAISGATLSCRNLTDGVRRLLFIEDKYLQYE